MTGPTHGVGRYRKLYINPETEFGTDPDGYPVAADALRLISASVSGKRPRIARPDANCTAGKDGSIAQKGTTEVQLESFFLNSGTAATAADWADLLVTCCGFTATASTDTTVSGGSSTTTVVDVVDATTTSVGGCVTISGELRLVTAVDTASTPDNITITPALTSAPANAVVVTGGIAYAPNSDSDTTPSSSTIWLGNNAELVKITGAYATAFSVGLGGTEAGRFPVTLTGKTFAILYAGQLDGALDNSQTDVTVDNTDMVPDDVSATNPYYFTISPGLAAEEFVQVTAKAGSDLTVVRASPSGSASAHDDNAVITPYQPAPTWAGSPVPATSGNAILASVVTRTESSSYAVDLGRQPEENVHGSEWTVDGYSNGMRTVTPTIEAFSDNATAAHRVRDAFNRDHIEAFTQQGEATGAVIAAIVQKMYPEVPDFAFSEEDMKWTLTGEAITVTVGGDDEVIFMHG